MTNNRYDNLINEIDYIINSSKMFHDTIPAIIKLIKKATNIEAVGIRLKDGCDFPYYQTDGFPKYFIIKEKYLCSYNQYGELLRDSEGNPYLECMCGNVLSGRTDPSLDFFTEYGSFWSNSTTKLLSSTTEEDRQSRTRNRCNSEGYESVV